MIYRQAMINDIPILVDLRKQQLLDEGVEPLTEIDEELDNFFYEKLNDNSLVEWLALENNEVIATAAIIFYQFPPVYTNKAGTKGYIANIYTKPEYRKMGIATNLLKKVINEAKTRGVSKLFLIASKDGRKLYQNFGFESKNKWMEIDLVNNY